ncbi:MAG: ribosome maturation factor RimP [Panacagrimonas sp.]
MLQDRLISLIEPLVESLGYELLLLEYGPQGRSALLRLFLDAADGVTLGDCERVSREVAALLDVEDPIRTAYQLEVSSPGLDRPLAKPEHFERFAGKKAKVELAAPLNGQKKFVGTICGTSTEGVRLAVEKGEVELAFSSIQKARLVPDYSIRTAEGEA